MTKAAKTMSALVSGVVGGVLSVAAMTGSAAEDGRPDISSRWEFRVLLNGRDVGRHRFMVERQGDRETVTIDADFDVKLLGISVYEYKHRNVEVWSQDCLDAMKTTTDDGGDSYSVYAVRVQAGLRVIANGRENLLPGCVMSFAYWNPDFLSQARLLNAQTGEYVRVSSRPVGEESIELPNGRTVKANRYRVSVEGTGDIDLWYQDNRRWVRLKSLVKGADLIYELLDTFASEFTPKR